MTAPERRPIGRGASGTVYPVDDRTVYKQYRRPVRPDPLAELIAWRESMPRGAREFLDAHCAWPIRLRLEHGLATGYEMHRAPGEFWADMQGEAHTVELQHLLHPRLPGLTVPPPQSPPRLALLHSLAGLMELFEENGLVYGDVGVKNVLWTLRGRPRVYLLDCDNARFTASSAPPGDVAAPRDDWADPRLGPGERPGPDSDRWALALFCHRVYYGATDALDPDRPPAPPRGEGRHPELYRLMLRGLTGADRPTAREWKDTVDGILHPAPPPPPAAPAPGPWWRRRRVAVAAGAAAAALLAGGVAVAVSGPDYETQPAIPLVLPGTLQSWAAGGVQITVRHYFAAVDSPMTVTKVAGWVALRVQIRNGTAGRLDLSAAPDHLVLLADTDPRGFNAPGVAAEGEISGPSGLKLYTIGFIARRQKLTHDQQHYDAGWDAYTLGAGAVFSAYDKGRDSAIYLVPPPATPPPDGTLTPGALHILGVAWVEHGQVLGFTPVSAWTGPNSFGAFMQA
ncbi:hypothetical protein ACPPVO_21145 [Dactylosporangium sp. McL0621]|uniref:hypothetical protein n=1 Tax=Dactylosporangium sp. McL0621 TaxID=3415678 RepID=UPI003CEEBC16